MCRHLFAGVLVLGLVASPGVGAAGDDPEPASETITFADLAPASAAQRFRPRVLALQGRRVRIVGYMARFESPAKGMFYLCPMPVALVDEGAGTGDLPPDSVWVAVPALAGRPVPFLPRPLEVTGVLDLGRREEGNGQVSWIRITVELPGPKPDPAPSEPPPS